MRALRRSTDDSEEKREQMRRQQHMQNLSSHEETSVDADIIRRISESELSVETISTLNNLVGKDWVLANFEDAEVHETRWLVRVMKDHLEAMHPDQDSIWQGEYRKYAFGDEYQALEPLSAAERLEIDEVIHGVISRATRSRDGWQQENFNKQIKQSETIDRTEDDSGGWLSR